MTFDQIVTIAMLCATVSIWCYLIGKSRGRKEEANFTEKVFAETIDRIMKQHHEVLSEFLDKEAREKFWKKILELELNEVVQRVLK